MRASSSPTVTSVASTSGSSRISRATRSPTSSVAATLRPSGRRISTSNCALSSIGKKPFFAILPVMPIEPHEAITVSTTTQRWRSTNESTDT